MLTTGARSANPGLYLSEASLAELLERAEIAENDSLLRELYGNFCKYLQLGSLTGNSGGGASERQVEQPLLITGSGILCWPVPSCTTITSDYGDRFHPIDKVYKMHYGIDIGGSYGAEIVAADSGTVTTSTNSGGYGNYVVINHGNGMTTLYAHMSSRAVSSGNVVSRGQVIGYIGSTGASTGPHLHFEVSVNGSRTDPKPYFS
jgi:murein DD-endopeptidase MepM/ murein hydrolase activator NlpD